MDNDASIRAFDYKSNRRTGYRRRFLNDNIRSAVTNLALHLNRGKAFKMHTNNNLLTDVITQMHRKNHLV